MVRALASHQCGPGSIPGIDAISGLSLLLVPVLAPRVFHPVLRFSFLHKKQNISKFQFQLPLCGCVTEIPINFFIFIYLSLEQTQNAVAEYYTWIV